MPTFSRVSQEKLATCHPDLQKVVNEVIKLCDITVLEGARSYEDQRKYFTMGTSKTMNSKHLVQPDGWSHAVDLAPYPIDWEDKQRFAYMAGLILGIAHTMGIQLTWGHDWDNDGDFKEHPFKDSPHFQLRK